MHPNDFALPSSLLCHSGGAAGDKRSAPSDGGGFAFGGGGGVLKEPKAAAAPFAGGSFGFGGASAPALESILYKFQMELERGDTVDYLKEWAKSTLAQYGITWRRVSETLRQLQGGGQEGGRRGGTENVPYIVGMGKAADMAVENLPLTMQHMEAMRSRLLTNLIREIGDDIRPNGPIDPQYRLPNTLSIGIPGIVSGSLLNKLGEQVAASAGAACHSSGTGQISSVLQAMNVPTEYAKGTLRLSIDPSTTADEIDRAVTIIANQVKLERQSKH